MRSHFHRLTLCVAACATAFSSGVLAEETPRSPVRFARDVRPILSEHCFQCHGPDEKKRQADLRLDVEADAKREIDGRFAIVPGDLARSELWRRVTIQGDEHMPPPETGRNLTPQQLKILRQWIEQGAAWENHWSLIPPRQAPLPTVSRPQWIHTPVDRFVLAKLDAEQTAPSEAADKQRLIRRVTLSLTGLPATPAEVDTFLADDLPGAYERVVERLLASPRYGERMAWWWLDAARYADTSGYQNDGPRFMWRWRDWVIDAFNHNMPFDQFTVEQIAGDLLPRATLEQRVATGFNRNHRGNAEGGIIPAEYQVEYVVDRVDTTSTVWLGLTMGCARCHDHKYDPLSQKDFYRVFAFFNNIPEYGRAIKEGNSPPFVVTPTPQQTHTLATLTTEVKDAEFRWTSVQSKLANEQLEWEKSPASKEPRQWFVERGLVASFDCNPRPEANAAQTTPQGKFTTESTGAGSVKFVGGEPSFCNGALGEGIELDGKRYVEAGDIGNFGYFDKFSAALWVKPKSIHSGTILSRMTDEEQGDGWYAQLRDGRVQVNLVKRWLDDAIRIETRDPIAVETWTHVAFTYDGSRQAKGIAVYLNGVRAPLEVRLDFINQTFATKEPVRLGGGNGPDGRFAGALDEVRLYDRPLTAEEVAILATSEPIHEIARLPEAERTPAQQHKLAAYFLNHVASEGIRDAYRQFLTAQQRQQLFTEQLPTVMVMEEMPQPRETHVLIRGEYDKPGEKVEPGIPGCFSVPEMTTNNRLGFARWLVDPSNPLMARVIVNRVWQMHFGAGLVRTTEDFGAQGESPSHPELLDWLAVEFMNSHWDLKHLHRLIVESATFRQSSKVDHARDPDNRLLARGPRFRLPAEMIRDQALAASGLLTDQLGGPSVKPYQPADLWKDLATDNAYVQDHGANLYRRSLYTYWKRTVAPPSMMTFDAAGREACQVRSARTNTPMQALALMNEVTYVEAARGVAQRVLHEVGDSPTERLTYAFRLATGRSPIDSELQLLVNSLTFHLEQFRREPDRAAMLLNQGELPHDPRLDPCELAAYTTVASLILNLDEVITRQ